MLLFFWDNYLSYYRTYCDFFCFKLKTAYEMRIRDWSSYVCSSDLLLDEVELAVERAVEHLAKEDLGDADPHHDEDHDAADRRGDDLDGIHAAVELVQQPAAVPRVDRLGHRRRSPECECDWTAWVGRQPPGAEAPGGRGRVSSCRAPSWPSRPRPAPLREVPGRARPWRCLLRPRPSRPGRRPIDRKSTRLNSSH